MCVEHLTMNTIKSNWNSVTNTCSDFGCNLRKKFSYFITTCFNNWHTNRTTQLDDEQKHQRYHRYHHQQQQQHNYFQHSIKSQSKRFSANFAFVQQHLCHQLKGEEKRKNRWLPAPAKEHYPTIDAKLLSSTPVPTTTTPLTVFDWEAITKVIDATAVEMTILEDTFTQVRNEHPDVDAEIRAILMARANEGATISDIKEDYRKNTGLPFPIFRNITSFLLTIPMVAAICNERGTQYFNVMPSEKTQHLFNLVKEQKSQQDNQQQYARNWRHNAYRKERNYFYNNNSSSNNYNYRNVNHYNNNSNTTSNDWNNQMNCYNKVITQQHQQQQLEVQQDLSENWDQQQQQQLELQHDVTENWDDQVEQDPQQQHAKVPQQQQLQLQQQQHEPQATAINTAGNVYQNMNNSQGTSYHDNVNHLYSRFYNQQMPHTPLTILQPPAQRNQMFNTNNNNINMPQQQQVQQEHQPEQAIVQQYNNNNNQNVVANDDHVFLVPPVAKKNPKNCTSLSEYQPITKRRHLSVAKICGCNRCGGGVGNYYISDGGGGDVGGGGAGESSGIGSVDRYYTSSSYAKSSQWNDSCYINCNSDYEAHLYDFPLLGDDFFLYMARMELNCKFRKSQRIYQAGLCVSGQTIQDATRRVQRLANCNQKFIVNIGSVDIMRGRTLLEIEHDYRVLIQTMQQKGITPILTTLAPLANYMHVQELRKTWERFNQFIERKAGCLLVIDIWSCLVNERGQTLFDCYQKGPRPVTGTQEPYVFWNKIGRQRVLKKIMSSVEY